MYHMFSQPVAAQSDEGATTLVDELAYKKESELILDVLRKANKKVRYT